MNVKKSLAIGLLSLSTLAFAQEESAPLVQADVLKNVDINLLLRSAYEMPSGTNSVNGFKNNEARLEIRGKLAENLNFRVRTRLNRTTDNATTNTIDGTTGALDYALLSYKFGEKREWEVAVGKQNNMMGSWEFDKNPTFEYKYSDVVGGYNSLFGFGARVGYSPNANHTFTIQAQNASNSAITSADINARTPMLFQAVWQGKFFNKVLQTWYSVGTSKVVEGKDNFHLSLGNKVAVGDFEAYLDLATTNFAYNHYSARYGTAEPTNVKSAVLRLDYKFLPKWNATAKGFYETASARKENTLGNNFRTNTGYMIGLEFLPVAKQNFRFFAYYYGNDVKTKRAGISSTVNNNVFAVGALWNVNVL